jgi:hypothetical protein
MQAAEQDLHAATTFPLASTFALQQHLPTAIRIARPKHGRVASQRKTCSNTLHAGDFLYFAGT